MVQPLRDEAEIFQIAREINAPVARAAYLRQACGDDAALHERVVALLKTSEEEQSFLEHPPAAYAHTVNQTLSEAVGTVIGPYKLLEQIGEGGFGIVYMADQQVPVRRRVALKVIKPGMDTKQVLARFQAELQALSLMDHPNIARALDAGATDSGRPYFVMELVRGVPITDYCDQNNLAVDQRLDLFVTVCHAVQHAHQKGIIHRDIKPSNVLVTMSDGRPVPKVIDFGVAKAINQQLTQETIFTRFAEMIGTPLYMSPEQAEMTSLDIDTRSDIYSLGVLLYELLTGSTPFSKDRLKNAAFDEIRRIIREEEPAKPSTRISTLSATSAAVAAHRHSNPIHLGRLMRGDLDWIVMKALEKDRTRRYETANGLAMDLQRHLADEPVLAGPPSAAYRFHKFARRNRAALTMIAGITAALVMGIVGTTWQAIQATRERNRAVTAEGLAQTRFEAASQARTAEAEQRAQAEANLQKARRAVDEYFTLVSESKLLDVPGLQPLRKDLLEAALRFYEKSSLERTNDPGALADLAVTHLRVAEVYLTINRTDECLASAAQALDAIDRLRRDYPAATEHHRRLAGYWKGSRPAQKAAPTAPLDGPAAMKTLERLLNTWQRLADENPSEIGFQSDLAAICAHLGTLLDWNQPDQATVFFDKAQHILESLVRQYPKVPEYRADLARVYETLVGTFGRLGRSADSKSVLRQSLELSEQLVADFPNVPQYRVDLTTNLHAFAGRSDTEQAVPAFRRAIDQAKVLVAEAPAVPLYRSLLTGIANDLLTLARKPGQHQQEAERLYRELMADVTQLAAENPEQPGEVWQRATASNYVELAKLLDKGGQREEAEKAYRQGIGILEKLAADHPDDRATREMLVQCYGLFKSALSAAGRTQEAEKASRQLLEVLQKCATGFPSDADVQHELGRVLLDRGRLEEAEACFRKEIEIDPRKNWAHHELGKVLLDRGRLEEAEACFRKEIEIDPRKNWTHHELGRVLRNRGRLEEAEACFRKVIEIDPKHFWSHFDLGDMLFAAGKVDEAVDCYRKVVEINPQEEWAQRKCGQFLLDRGRTEEAEAPFRKAIEIDPRQAWSYALLIDVLLPQGKHAEAAKLAVELSHLSPDNSESLRAAVYLEQCAAVAKLDTSLTPADLKASSDAYAKQAVELMIEASKRVAGNGQLENQLAWGLVTNPKPELRSPARAVELARKAVELAPTAGNFWNTLGVAQYRAGDWKASEAAFQNSFKFRDGGDSFDWFFLSMAARRLGQEEKARKWYDAACLWMAKNAANSKDLKRFSAEAGALLGVEQQPLPQNLDDLTIATALIDAEPNTNASWCWRSLAEDQIRAGHWSEAKPKALRWAELQPNDEMCQYCLAALLARCGDVDAYRRQCQLMLTRYAETNQPEWAERTAKVCLILPGTGDTLAAASRLAERAVTLGEKQWILPWAQVAQAMAAYRRGDFRATIEWCDKALTKEADNIWYRNTQAHYIRAIALARLGQTAEAKASFEKADEILQKMREASKTERDGWHDLAICELLQREAQQLLGEPNKADPPNVVRSPKSH